MPGNDQLRFRVARGVASVALIGGFIWSFGWTGGGGHPPGREFDIRFDFAVVDQFLGFLERGVVTDAEIDLWVGLQGNRELLRQGRRQGGLSPQTLKTAVRVTIEGKRFPGAGPLGRLDVGPWPILREIVDSIRSREGILVRRAANSLSPYLPGGRFVPPLRVFFHLGGDWDGRASDQVYVNLSFFHSRGVDSLPGLEALLVHELFHRAQAAISGSVDDYSSRHSALFTVMQRVHREGIARHLEYLYLEREFETNALDRTNYQKYRDGLRSAAEHGSVLSRILDRLFDGDRLEARRIADDALSFGGPLYAVGHAMARTIEADGGAAALVGTVIGGPIAFFDAYEDAVRRTGQVSVLPSRLGPEIDALRGGYGSSWLVATRLRREGTQALFKEDLELAIEALGRAVGLDETDAISAYNLACAYALEVERRRDLRGPRTPLENYALANLRWEALRWLEVSLRRGFDDHKQVRVDPDLYILHDDPEYRETLLRHGIEPPGQPPSRPARDSINP